MQKRTMPAGVIFVAAICAACIEVPDDLPPFQGTADSDPASDTGPEFEMPDAALLVIGDATPDAAPPPEICNGLDDDGDGAVDEGLERLIDPDEPGQSDDGRCRQVAERCVDGQFERRPDRAFAEEVCDGIDNDCDNLTDEGLSQTCVWCDGTMLDPPCNGCPDRIIVPPGFACVPPGSFRMGSPSGQQGHQPDEAPTHPVVLQRPYLIGITEVPQGGWTFVFGPGGAPPDPSWFRAGGSGGACDAQSPGQCPVERLSWYDALWLSNRVSAEAGRSPCYVLQDCDGEPMGGCDDDEQDCTGDYLCRRIETVPGCTGFRLPTEAEWARAARAGSDLRFWSGDTPRDLDRTDIFRTNSDGRPHSPARNPPTNAFGLIDVHGNVSEWTFDSYTRYPDPPQERVDPRIDDGDLRVSRGGAWDSVPDACRSAAREALDPAVRSARRGMRMVLETAPAPYFIDAPAETIYGGWQADRAGIIEAP